MILVAGGTKGGSGKTLLATSLSVLRTAAGQDVLLIDADEQGSAMDFTRQRQRRTEGDAGYTAIQTREADVAVQVRRMVQKYGDIVIDVGGRDTASQRAALAVADALLIPFPPTSVDLWTSDTVVTLLKEAQAFNPRLRAYAIINKASELARAHRMQLWDCVVCAAATQAGAKALLTEDMQDGRIIESLRLINPFAPANAEAIETLLAVL